VEELVEDWGTGGLVAFGPRPFGLVVVVVGVLVEVTPSVVDSSSSEEEEEVSASMKILSVPAATPQPRRVYPEADPWYK